METGSTAHLGKGPSSSDLSEDFPEDAHGSLPPVETGYSDPDYQQLAPRRLYHYPITANMKPKPDRRPLASGKPHSMIPAPRAPLGGAVVKHHQMSGGSFRSAVPALSVPPPSVIQTPGVVNVNTHTMGGGTMMSPMEIEAKTFSQRPSLSPHPPPPPDASSYHSSVMYAQPILPAHSPGPSHSAVKAPQVPMSGFKASLRPGHVSPAPSSPSPGSMWATGVNTPRPQHGTSPVKTGHRQHSPGPPRTWPPANPPNTRTPAPLPRSGPPLGSRSIYQDGRHVGAGEGLFVLTRNKMSGGSEVHLDVSTRRYKSTVAFPAVPWSGKIGDIPFGPRDGKGSLSNMTRLSPLSVETGTLSTTSEPSMSSAPLMPATSRQGDTASPVRLPQVGYSPSASPLALSPYESDKAFQPLVSPNILNIPHVSSSSGGTDVSEALDLTKDSKAKKAKDLNSNVTSNSSGAAYQAVSTSDEQDEPLDLVKTSRASATSASTPYHKSLFANDCMKVSQFESFSRSKSGPTQELLKTRDGKLPCEPTFSSVNNLSKSGLTVQESGAASPSHNGCGPRSSSPSMEGEGSTSPSLCSESRASMSVVGEEDRTGQDSTVWPSLQGDAVSGTASPSLQGDDTVSSGQFADAYEPSQQVSTASQAQTEKDVPAVTMDPTDQEEEPEFTWDDYLEETASEAVPPTSFKHVELSLQSFFAKGMKLEVAKKSTPDTYWLASIIMPCGQLLRLRYYGYGEDGKADFWCDAFSSDIHPLGWCKEQGKTLEPPEDLKSTLTNWKEDVAAAAKDAETVPANILEAKAGTAPIDHIQPGMYMDIQHTLSPLDVWLAKVVENVGGRLLLRYEGAAHANADFWLFYLDHRLHPVGWGKDRGLPYQAPPEIAQEHKNKEEWDKVLEKALEEVKDRPLPGHIFKDQAEVVAHRFQAGWKLEVLHPGSNVPYLFPATVARVIDECYFMVQIDDVSCALDSKRVQMCCHSNSPGIYPVGWCSKNGARLMPPEGWDQREEREFNWEDYLQETRSEAAPESAFNLVIPQHDFAKNAKLEAVDPEHPAHICVATVTNVIGSLLWLHLESSPKIMASHIVDVESHNIFPVGWCESNSYQLKPPRKSAFIRKSKMTNAPPAPGQETYTQLKQTEQGSGWCPKIYFNHRCFSGPFLSKGRIAELPKCVGPGPVTLVMKEVLSMLINVAYKSSRVLREIQMEDAGTRQGMHQQVLKAKYKGKSYRATVQLCKSSDQIVDFCRSICIKLECCPNLFSPTLVNGNCPERCDQLTKTKYTYYYGKKKKKIGRPPGGHSNLENGPRKPGKRGRRRRRYGMYIDRTRPSADSEETNNSEAREEEMADDDTNSNVSLERQSENNEDPIPKRRKKRRDYNHFVPPPTQITTRGAKGPKYSFERRTHQKVIHHSPPMKSPKKRRHVEEEPKSEQSHSMHALREAALVLDTNPLWWSVQEVVDYLKTTDCANLVRILKEQEIDGQAFMMLTLPAVQDFIELKLGPAVKLCHEVERVKVAFFEQFAHN